jgi:diaminohydroxyphosphoribosylaminopyrimidine deaminase/5-amino-6-(5-phosphoribosylamino)uracil reductase
MDDRWMRRALELAARGAGDTNPNPLVGCVIVRGGGVVGEGFHRRAGGPHAEVAALKRAGSRARGATLYVNLEPCSHLDKRTPPCAPTLAVAGLRRVVVAMRDPNPRVNGRGLTLLRRAGVDAVTGMLEAEARRLNERYAVAVEMGRPFVLLKAALTLDGRIATAAGESKWITSAAQRRAARRLRRLHDGVLVGIGTVLADDPLLLPSPRTARPFHRIVLDSRLRIPTRSRLVRSAHRSPVLVLCGPGAGRKRALLESRGVTVLEALSPRRRAPARALRALWRRGITSLIVEGGSEVLGSFLHARHVDKLVLFRAPLLLGGRGSLPAFGGPDPRHLSAALRFVRGPHPEEGLYEVWYPRHRNRKERSV